MTPTTTAEHPHAGDPVLVDRAEACAVLGITDTSFARLCREGKFENMCMGGGSGYLYRSAELRAYRAGDRRRVGSVKNRTNDIPWPSKSAEVRASSGMEIGAHAGEALGTTNGTWPVCRSCRRQFRPHRAGQRACSPACRQRARRRATA